MRIHIAFLLLTIMMLVSTQDTVIIISSHHHQSILGQNDLSQHITNLPASSVQSLTIKKQCPFVQLLRDIQPILKSFNFTKQQLSSFTIENTKIQTFKEDVAKLASTNFSEISWETMISKLAELKRISESKESGLKKSLILHFNQQSKKTRMLSETQENVDEPSSLFLNMTPEAASGLLVSLFILIVLGIAICCLMDIKTHDKYGKKNLWVGKES